MGAAGDKIKRIQRSCLTWKLVYLEVNLDRLVLRSLACLETVSAVAICPPWVPLDITSVHPCKVVLDHDQLALFQTRGHKGV